MIRGHWICSGLVLVLAAGCGGGGGGGGSSRGPDPDPVPVVSLSPVAGQATAVEKSGQYAKFQVTRTGPGDALSINFTVSGHPDSAKGSATGSDFELHYSDGGMVSGTTLILPANQNNRVVEVRPVADALNEVPETGTFTLNGGSGYRVGTTSTAAITIIDAANTDANRKVFLGTFVPQGGVATSGSGTASFIPARRALRTWVPTDC